MCLEETINYLHFNPILIKVLDKVKDLLTKFKNIFHHLDFQHLLMFRISNKILNKKTPDH
jgi:hypothetical protein